MSSSFQRIPFTKASACGNDFLIVEGAGFAGDLAAISQRMCDRHNGVGADGVEWLFPDAEADIAARLFNADGSEAEISGNGTRCVAACLCLQKEKAEFVVRTGAGPKRCTLKDRQGFTFEFEADMGKPSVGDELTIDTQQLHVAGIRVSMGNPHYVTFVDRFAEGWQRQAALIAAQPVFPDGTNIEYVAVRGPSEIEIRLYERGVGETQSSGTGACAAVVAAIASRRVTSPVRVVAPGGAQAVRWENHLYLQGPAALLCQGAFFV